MPYSSGDIKFYNSTQGLGGEIGNPLPNNALHSVFPPLTSEELVGGVTDYACIYIVNTTQNKTFYRVRVYIQEAPDSRPQGKKETIYIGLDPQSGSPVQTIPNRTTPPQNVSFFTPLNYAQGVEIGTLPPGGKQAIWLKREAPPGTQRVTNAKLTLAVEGFAI